MTDHNYIDEDDELIRYCESLNDSEVIAMDTEFLSETTYRPQLCLIQVADDRGDVAIIDPLALSTTKPFWELMGSGRHTIVAHAAREEIRFCDRLGGDTDTDANGHGIDQLFDTQLAAGFVGIEYPISLAALVDQLLGRQLSKGETRTDWSRRPLSPSQVRYAIADVTDLHAIHDRLLDGLRSRERLDWFEEEIQLRQDKVLRHDRAEHWRRFSGVNSLRPRAREIVRQLWQWREQLAESLDRLPKRVLRDDLIIELARMGTSDMRRIRNLRGMERRNLQSHLDDIADAIDAALQMPEDDLPQRIRGPKRVATPMLGQFLTTSMACVARTHELSPAIVGNSDDVKEFLHHELYGRDETDAPPSLTKGWRGNVVGDTLRSVMRGETAIRIHDVQAKQPLEFVDIDTP